MANGDRELAFLWQLAVVDASSPDIEGLDWPRLTKLLRTHRAEARATARLRAWDLWSQLPESVTRFLARVERAAEIKAELQWGDLVELREALGHAGIQMVALKGATYRWLLYEEAPSSRTSRDVDILIHREHIPAIKDLMYSLGFRQSAWIEETRRFATAHPQSIADVEATHYELGQFVRRSRLLDLSDEDAAILEASPEFFFYRDDALYSYSVIDVHWNLNHFFDPREVFARTRKQTLNGVEFSTLQQELDLVYAATKVYFESFDQYGEGLVQFEDFARLVRREGKSIDWQRVRDIADRYVFSACCFYVLSHVPDLGVPLPDGALALLDDWRDPPKVEPITVRDHGDFLPFLIGRRHTIAPPAMSEAKPQHRPRRRSRRQ